MTRPGPLLACLTLAAIVAACLLAPVYARFVAGADPFRTNVGGAVQVNGRSVDVLAENTEGLGIGTTPIGPTGRGAYLLGADGLGRDVAARLLYGGRTSLLIASAATLVCLALGVALGVLAAAAGGWVDAVLAWGLDMLWAFPVYLLAISLSVVLVSEGLRLGPITVEADSLLLPIAILAVVFVPYVARPVRSQAAALLGREWVTAAVSIGTKRGTVLRRHVIPHLLPTVAALAPALLAITLLTEAALSLLSIGVQAPAASWGTLIADGQTLLVTRPVVALAPGAAIALTVLALNTLGEAVQRALSPPA